MSLIGMYYHKIICVHQPLTEDLLWDGDVSAGIIGEEDDVKRADTNEY